MEAEIKTITINGIEYAEKNPLQSQLAEQIDGMRYYIIRTYSAGVFAGYVKLHKGKLIELVNARRLWQWYGASSLSQMAMEGTKQPDKCKFPCEVSNIILTEAIEIILCTEQARKSIAEVKIWEQK